MACKYEMVIWDWNGTLFDDVDACIRAENRLLAQRGMRLLASREEYHNLFSFPVRAYYQRLGFDFQQEPYELLSEIYEQNYEREMRACGLAPGAIDALLSLDRAGLRQALISAAERASLQRQMSPFNVHTYFETVIGSDNRLANGKAGVAAKWLAQAQVPLSRTVFLGDTTHDFAVASQLGCDCLLVEGGHQGRSALQKTGAPVFPNLTTAASYLLQTPAKP